VAIANGTAPGSAMPANTVSISSARSMAMLRASRTRLSRIGEFVHGRSHQKSTCASWRRVTIDTPEPCSSFTRSRLTSTMSASPRRSSAIRVVSSGTMRNVSVW